MKIGISTSTFFNTVAAENMFDLMRKMRIDTTEFCLNTFSDYEKDYVDKLAALRGGVGVAAVSPLATQFEPQLFSPNVRVRADAELIFRKVCYACFAFGAKFYTFRGPINLNDVKEFDYGKLAQRFAQLADIAATYGVNLSLKNMRWSYASTPEFFKKLFDKCSRIFATFGVFHAEKAGYDIREFLDVCPPERISLIEVQDFVKNEWCLPGKGKYRFDRLFSDLDRRQITAPVLFAAQSDSYTDFVQVRDAFEFLVGEYKSVKQ
ncbi:sugar phosphate isomerase/epimerase family protein [Anaerocaecibacter muris]|uniref:sugar phosphate isomerase/epimerase family protein n=1 Tax=Anaerocaecibacter muris TaxID=2941513 RepID=UPI003F68EEE0